MNTSTFATITALLLGSAIATNAATGTLPANFVQNISVQLTVTSQGGMSTNAQGTALAVKVSSINTKAVINAIGVALTNTFSANAQLIYVAPISYYTNPIGTIVHGKSVTNDVINGYPGTGAVQIRDGAKIVDITSLFQIATVSNLTVSSYTVNKQGGYTSYTGYSIRSVTVTNSALAFSGQGFVQTPLVAISVKGATIAGYNNKWTSFCGVTANGVLQGTISATYAKLE